MAVTELEQIAKRIRARDDLTRSDRERQRALIRQRIAEGATWDEIQREAQVSRPTIAGIVKRPD